MSVRRLAGAELQPASFSFSDENQRFADGQVAKYPKGRQASAVIALLWQAQKQHGGWLPKPAIEAVAARLGMPIIRVMEVATFYTMFNLEPVGRFFVQLCGTVPCHVMGAIDLKQALLEKVGDQNHVTPDGNFSWLEVECLGACCNAPMVQINEDYYEDLTPDLLVKLLDDLAAGKTVTPGPQNGRRSSEPQDGVKTLSKESLHDGSVVGAWRRRFEEHPAKDTASQAAAAGGAHDASGANDPKPAKPDAGRAEHRPVTDAPAQQAKAEAASKPDAAPSAEPARETPPQQPAISGHSAETRNLDDVTVRDGAPVGRQGGE